MTVDEPTEPTYVSPAAAREQWAAAAFDLLFEAAHHYGATITHANLAAQVQERTGLATRADPKHWIGPVLSVVMRRCAEENLPPLTSLAVAREEAAPRAGSIITEAGEILAKREQTSALARLRCYRRFAPDIPDDVVHALAVEERERAVREAARPRARESRAGMRTVREPAAPRQPKRAPREEEICPTCFTALPATGVCDTCG